jgi:hypothetical protein
MDDHSIIANRRLLRLAALIFVVFSMIGCSGHTSIADINRDPARFASKDITISGQASDSVGAFGNGVFRVDDGTGQIWVFSQNFGLPGNGAKVSVTGQVQQGFSFGGHTYGVVFRETKALE